MAPTILPIGEVVMLLNGCCCGTCLSTDRVVGQRAHYAVGDPHAYPAPSCLLLW